MAAGLDKATTMKEKPEEWKESRMRLIKKKSKPTIKDFRPISLTNISYKMYMSFLKEEIEEHLRRNYLTKENQTGFTKGGRKEENLFMMQYVMRRAIRSGKQLIVIAIDYSKAYDSIDRKKLIEQLIEYKIHPNVIDTIAKLYKGDFTRITIGEEQVKLNVTNGIRQGCTLSTTLFKGIEGSKPKVPFQPN